MRPFNLEAAKQGEPICTRKGVPAKFIAHIPEAIPGSRVIALVDGNVIFYHSNGRFMMSGEDGADLFMMPKTKVAWFNLHDNGVWTQHETKEQADIAGGRESKWPSIPRLGDKAFCLEFEE